MSRVALLAAAWLAAGPARAATITRVWDAPADFAGGEAYAVVRGGNGVVAPGPAGGLTLARQSAYAADPAAGAGAFWAKTPAGLAALPHALVDHAVARSGPWIFVLGGCQDPAPGCGATGIQTVATVWRARLNAAGGTVGPWASCAWELAQTANAAAGIPMRRHRAIGVGDRIYVVGGSTEGCLTVIPGGQPATTAVYSAPVDPATGEAGPWVQEISLPVASGDPALVYAAGSLFSFGGYRDASFTPHRFVSRAAIRPDGRLGSAAGPVWDAAGSIPPGVPTCAPCADCLGWLRMASFAAMRTIGFIGGAYQNFNLGSTCSEYRGARYTFLDDCNGPAGWTETAPPGTLAARGASAVAANGTLVVVGGEMSSGSARPDVLFNPAGTRGIRRMGGADKPEAVPASPDGTGLYDGKAPDPYPMADLVEPAALVAWSDDDVDAAPVHLYAIGGAATNATGTCSDVYRGRLDPTAEWADAGSWVSPPYDLGAAGRLTRVAWAFDKTGAAAGDDWAMLRYRVADESGAWSCWTPRIPEENDAPAAAGHYVYASDAPAIAFREPLSAERCRYIQFEVSLYNDPANDAPVPTVPTFDRFEVALAPSDPPRPLKPGCPVEIYPSPATSGVTLRFEVAPAGAVVAADVYNAAGESVLRRDFPAFQTGGVKEVALATGTLANGAYVLLLKGRALAGGPGLYCSETGRKTATLKERFLVRRR